MGHGADELSDDLLLPAGSNGSYRRSVTRSGLFILADDRNFDGGVCIPGRLGVCRIPVKAVHGKSDDLLSGIVGAGIHGQRRNVVLHLPQDAEKCQSPEI